MRQLLFALAFCLPMCASAAEVTISCLGPESDDCPVAVDVVLEHETLVASFNQRRVDGVMERVELLWCTGFNINNGGIYRWLPLQGSCETKSSFRTVNGELTKRQLAESGLVLSTRQVQSQCHDGYESSCVTKTRTPPNERFRLSCIGPESADCPVVVEVKLQGDALVGTFYSAPDSRLHRTRTDVEWSSGFSVTGDAPLRWRPYSGGTSRVWGSSKPLDGELTKRQLAEAAASFETRTLEAACYFVEGTSQSSQKPVCLNVLR